MPSKARGKRPCTGIVAASNPVEGPTAVATRPPRSKRHGQLYIADTTLTYDYRSICKASIWLSDADADVLCGHVVKCVQHQLKMATSRNGNNGVRWCQFLIVGEQQSLIIAWVSRKAHPFWDSQKMVKGIVEAGLEVAALTDARLKDYELMMGKWSMLEADNPKFDGCLTQRMLCSLQRWLAQDMVVAKMLALPCRLESLIQQLQLMEAPPPPRLQLPAPDASMPPVALEEPRQPAIDSEEEEGAEGSQAQAASMILALMQPYEGEGLTNEERACKLVEMYAAMLSSRTVAVMENVRLNELVHAHQRQGSLVTRKRLELDLGAVTAAAWAEQKRALATAQEAVLLLSALKTGGAVRRKMQLVVLSASPKMTGGTDSFNIDFQGNLLVFLALGAEREVGLHRLEKAMSTTLQLEEKCSNSDLDKHRACTRGMADELHKEGREMVDAWKKTPTHESVIQFDHHPFATTNSWHTLHGLKMHTEAEVLTIFVEGTSFASGLLAHACSSDETSHHQKLPFNTTADCLATPISAAIAIGKQVHLLLLGCNMSDLLSKLLTALEGRGCPLLGEAEVPCLHVCYTYDTFPGGVFPLVIAAYGNCSVDLDLLAHQRQTKAMMHNWKLHFEKSEGCLSLAEGQVPWPDRMLWTAFGAP